jgi:hypothetical protein
MSNLAAAAAGAEVLMASAFDERHPPDAILDSYALLLPNVSQSPLVLHGCAVFTVVPLQGHTHVLVDNRPLSARVCYQAWYTFAS